MPGDQALDFSFRGLAALEGLRQERPKKAPRKGADGRFQATCLKLNNNQIENLAGISTVFADLLDSTSSLTWLDLSFNRLLSIPDEISLLPSLKILYLHGNHLVDLQSVLGPLRSLDNLYGLTLHGNPVEERKNYRCKVLTALPHLRTLDFNMVTQSEKEKLSKKRPPASPCMPRRAAGTSPSHSRRQSPNRH